MRFRPLDWLAVTAMRVGVIVTLPLLLVFARTWPGRVLGFVVWMVIALGVNWLVFTQLIGTVMNVNRPPPLPPKLFSVALLTSVLGGLVAGILVLIGLVLFLVATPRYVSSPVPNLLSEYPGPEWLLRWQMVLPPEEDALWLGVCLVSRLDWRMNSVERQQLRDRMREFLDEMKEYPEYRVLAPALPLSLWGSMFLPDFGHFFAYIPEPDDANERLGLLVFLHGHGGNAVLNLHVWREFAERNRLVIVCPTFGYGNWEHPDSPKAVERCVNYALGRYPVNPERVFLAGISQGGAGVSRAAVAFPEQFAGLIYLSPTMEQAVLQSPEFAEGWTGRRVFVAQGGRDHNVKPQSVNTAVEWMQTHGVNVEYHFDPNADHFLFFAQLEGIQARLEEWMRA